MKTEFEFIDHIRKKLGAERIGDDCAVLSKDDKSDQLITADLLVEDVDFRLDWTTPKFLGHKALAVSLSDIAAMGGSPKYAMVSIGVPENVWDSDFLQDFYDGWGNLASEFGVELIGGDISRTPDKIVVDSIVIGEVEKGKAILRTGARPGDAIYVTGTLGGAAAGLSLVESGYRINDAGSSRNELIRRQLCPSPQVELGRLIHKHQLATSMIDLSDGLSSDLAHICSASGVGAEIERESIPFDPNLSELYEISDDVLDLALNGGEDFRLLFTADEKKNPAGFDPQIFRIGTVTANVGIIELIGNGNRTEITPKGFRHF